MEPVGPPCAGPGRRSQEVKAQAHPASWQRLSSLDYAVVDQTHTSVESLHHSGTCRTRPSPAIVSPVGTPSPNLANVRLVSFSGD